MSAQNHTNSVNLTALRTAIAPLWVASPDSRGTWELLYGCAFTIGLCVYTAIHPNVPPPDESGFGTFLRKTKWAVIAIFAPEIVVVSAFMQWKTAKQFVQDLNDIAKKSTDEKFKKWFAEIGDEFDMVYGHYVVMGGFVADVAQYHNVAKRVAITPEGILYMARHDEYCQIPNSQIQDRSKADLLAKSLVCLQVLGVASQVLERKAANYPITLLEVHTLVHVACALCMYGLWAKKPQNVQEPINVSATGGLKRHQILAYLLQTSQAQFPARFRGFERTMKGANVPTDRRLCRKECRMAFFKNPAYQAKSTNGISTNRDEIHPSRLSIEKLYQQMDAGTVQVLRFYGLPYQASESSSDAEKAAKYSQTYSPVSNEPTVRSLSSGEVVSYSRIDSPYKIGPDFKTDLSFAEEDSRNTLLQSLASFQPRILISLTNKDVRRLALVSQWYTKLHEETTPIIDNESSNPAEDMCTMYNLLNEIHHDLDVEKETIYESPGLRVYMPDWSGLGIEDWFHEELGIYTHQSDWFPPILALLPVAYGGIHYSTLSFQFPTPAERRLWQAACLVSISVGAALELGICSVKATGYLKQVWQRRQERKMQVANTDIPSSERSPVGTHFFQQLRNTLRSAFQTFQCLSSILEWSIWDLGNTYTQYAAFGLVFIVIFMYFAARFFLVVESFISLRHVPIGVYQTPSINFMSYIPHI